MDKSRILFVLVHIYKHESWCTYERMKFRMQTGESGAYKKLVVWPCGARMKVQIYALYIFVRLSHSLLSVLQPRRCGRLGMLRKCLTVSRQTSQTNAVYISQRPIVDGQESVAEFFGRVY